MSQLDAASPLQPVDAKRLPGLDGLRAVAIVLVLIEHAWSTLPIPQRFQAALQPYALPGQFGVIIFFVLSGYLITYLLRQEIERSGTLRLSHFYARRVLRIFPAAYAFLLVILILKAAGFIQTTGGDIIRAGTFANNFAHFVHPHTNADLWFVGHFWTLSLEEQFYLFWPIALLIAGLRRGAYLALAAVVALPLVRSAGLYLTYRSGNQGGLMLHSCVDPMMFGCLLALCERTSIVDWIKQRCQSWICPAVCIAFLIFPTLWLAARYPVSYQVTIGITLEGIALMVLILGVVHYPARGLTRFLELRPMRALGILSYSLYLWQELFLGDTGVRWRLGFPLNILLCLAAAIASSFLIERPFLRLRSRFRPAMKQPATPREDSPPAQVERT